MERTTRTFIPSASSTCDLAVVDDLGDLADQAAGGHDRVATAQVGNHFLMLLHPLALRPDDQEIHDRKNRHERQDLDQETGGPAGPAACAYAGVMNIQLLLRAAFVTGVLPLALASGENALVLVARTITAARLISSFASSFRRTGMGITGVFAIHATVLLLPATNSGPHMGLFDRACKKNE